MGVSKSICQCNDKEQKKLKIRSLRKQKQLGDQLYYMKSQSQSCNHFKKYLQIYKQLKWNDEIQKAQVLYKLGIVSQCYSNIFITRQNINQSIKIYNRIKEESNIYYWKGLMIKRNLDSYFTDFIDNGIYFLQKLPKILQNFQQSMNKQEINSYKIIDYGEILLQLGYLQSQSQQYNSAVENIKKAIVYFKKIPQKLQIEKNKMISYAYKLLRNIQMNRLNYKVAILYFNLEQKYYTFENKLYKIDALRKLKLCLNQLGDKQAEQINQSIIQI